LTNFKLNEPKRRFNKAKTNNKKDRLKQRKKNKENKKYS